MSIRTIAATKAVKILDALQATYSIALPDGTTYEKKRRHAKPVNDFASTGYAEKVKNLGKGDSIELPFNGYNSTTAERFRGAIAAKASQTWGKGSCISHIDRNKGTIEVLRVK